MFKGTVYECNGLLTEQRTHGTLEVCFILKDFKNPFWSKPVIRNKENKMSSPKYTLHCPAVLCRTDTNDCIAGQTVLQSPGP
jgi:hypothetical protein